jgi:hypothetical protein
MPAINTQFLRAAAVPAHVRHSCPGHLYTLLLLTSLLVTTAQPTFGPSAAPTTTGEITCPCLTSHGSGLDAYKNGNGDIVYADFIYPDDYGLGCKKQDIDPVPLQPYCGDEDGNLKSHAPLWCDKSFCYVDPNNCSQLYFRSGYFPNANLFYSFQTCGSNGTFNEWFDNNNNGHNLEDLADVVENYVESLRSNLEMEYITLASATSLDCNTTSSCPCSNCACVSNDCSLTTGWKDQKVDFVSTIFVPHAITPPSSRSECLANTAGIYFTNIASVEYQDTHHVGTLYGGYQEDGSFYQWPSIDWCPTTYDPRFRPWYSAATSNPKIVIIVIDVSGSMGGNRIDLAREAAKAVVKTLTWVDQIGFVLFSDVVEEKRAPVYLVESSEITAINSWIDHNIYAGGATSFYEPLDAAIAMIQDAPSACTRAILFLTDGEASFSEENFESIREDASQSDIIIFTYGIGSGVATCVITRLACENNGIAYALEDESALSEVMSSYYTYFAASINSQGSRWVLYDDYTTGTELLSACTPLYDKSNNQSDVSVIFGVVCMDINVMVSVENLRVHSGWNNLFSRVKAASDSCKPHWSGFNAIRRINAIESIRSQNVINGAMTCDSCSISDGAMICTACPSFPIWAIVLIVIACVVVLCVCFRKKIKEWCDPCRDYCERNRKVHVGECSDANEIID